MARIRRRETGPELALRRALWRRGLRYRTHALIPGRPDIVFADLKLAVFIDGCFWHSCPKHGVSPKANRAFWATKLSANVARDKKTNAALRKLGWRVVRFWEHDVEADADQCAVRVVDALKSQRLKIRPGKSMVRANEGVRR